MRIYFENNKIYKSTQHPIKYTKSRKGFFIVHQIDYSKKIRNRYWL